MTRLLTESGAARLLGISTQAVRQLVRERRVPFVELPSGDVRFDGAELLRWIGEYRRPPLPVEPPEVLALSLR